MPNTPRFPFGNPVKENVRPPVGALAPTGGKRPQAARMTFMAFSRAALPNTS